MILVTAGNTFSLRAKMAVPFEDILLSGLFAIRSERSNPLCCHCQLSTSSWMDVWRRHRNVLLTLEDFIQFCQFAYRGDYQRRHNWNSHTWQTRGSGFRIYPILKPIINSIIEPILESVIRPKYRIVSRLGGLGTQAKIIHQVHMPSLRPVIDVVSSKI